MSINTHWDQLLHWITQNAPELEIELNGGASLTEIQRLEEKIGHKLPEDFRNFYSSHNGQKQSTGRDGLIHGDSILSISEIITVWDGWEEFRKLPFYSEFVADPNPGLKADWWNSLWIPFTSNGGGDSYCIDLDPSDSGKKGQVLRLIHDEPQRTIHGHSFSDWIDGYLAQLASGVYIFSEKYGIVDAGLFE